MAKTNYVKKKLTLNEFLALKPLVFQMYEGIRDFNVVLEIHSNVIDPIDKILMVFNKKQDSLKERAVKAQEEKDTKILEELDKEFSELLNQEIEIELYKIKKEDIEKLKFNVFQFGLIKEFVEL